MVSLTQSPVVRLSASLLTARRLEVWVKRDDLLQPGGDQQFCGNKVRKLLYNLQAARASGAQRLLTFGGAFSNHIAAVARAGHLYGFQTVGVIRGEPHHPLNPTLALAEKQGMELHYLDRETYRQKSGDSVMERLKYAFGDFFLLPEGGTNGLALEGCAEIIPEIKDQLGQLPDYIGLACGTGGTMAGIIRGARGQSRIIGVTALKGNFMEKEIRALLQANGSPAFNNWEVYHQYHFGGYAKFPVELQDFVREFKRDHGITLDPVYTSKLFYGFFDQIRRGAFPPGSSLLLLHTGGLQGWSAKFDLGF